MGQVCTICGQDRPLEKFACLPGGGKRRQCYDCRGRRYPASREARQRAQAKFLSTRPHFAAEYRRKQYAENPRKILAYNAARHRRVQTQTPPWADMEAIRRFYEACPSGFHVDHIVPLNGQIVSGLHVRENLQYLPAAENCRKGRKFNLERNG